MGFRTFTVKKWKKLAYTANGNPVYSFELESSGHIVKGKTKPNAGFVFGIPSVYPGDKISVELSETPSGRIYMTDFARQNPAPKSKSNQDVFTRANQLLKEGYGRKQAFAIAYRERDEDLAHLFGKSKTKKNPAPKRKTAARTQRAAVGYVSRPSQITKKAPSKRLKTRRTKNLQVPRGVFPNPSMTASQVRAKFNAAWRDRVRYVPAYKNDIPAKREFFSTFIDELYSDGLITERMLNNVTMEGRAKNNPSSVHFDIDVNSHNARGSRAKTRVNPAARKKEIIVEYELSGHNFAKRNRGMYGWKELAKFPDTPEGSENAIQYAQAYHKIAPHLRIQVVTK